jgi:ribosomal protein S18 acetylase RimI-like enzyme
MNSGHTSINFAQLTHVERDRVEPLRAIYFEAFPPSERGDFSNWLNEIEEGARWLFLAEVQRKIVGFATILPWVTDNTHLLEYLAIAIDHRGHHFGSQLLKYIAKTMQVLGKADGIFWEVESDEYGTDAERILRQRRIAFYHRNGGQLVDCAPRYLVPNLIGGEPLEMKIMWLPLREGAPPLRGTRLRECVMASYVRDYGLATNDPLLHKVLQDLVC